MKVIDFNQAFYCLYATTKKGEEVLHLRQDITPNSTLHRLDLFETEEAAFRWIEEEQKIHAAEEWWGLYKIYEVLYPKKIFITEFANLMEENKEIDCVSFIDQQNIRQLYYRNDLEEYGYDYLPVFGEKIHPREPILILNRQRELDEGVILKKEAYFITHPEVAIPLFSIGVEEWAEIFLSRKPNQGYYIDQTTLEEVYMRSNLKKTEAGFFILFREESPHFLLRKKDLKNIVEDKVDYK